MHKNKRLSISSLLNDNGTDEEQQPKTKRKRITPAQYNRLMEIFDQTDTPSSEIRENLATELNMTKREVQASFICFIQHSINISLSFRFGFKIVERN
jgi:hypothetical protein